MLRRGYAAVNRGDIDGLLVAVHSDVEFTSLTISHCRDGKIAEEWELIDTVGLLRQIGALPEPAGGVPA